MSQTSVRPGVVGDTFPALARVAPAGIGRRALARLLDIVIGLAASGALTVIAILGPDPSDPQAVTLFALAVQVVSVVLGVGVLVVFALTGLLPGGAILGLRQVRVATGGPPGAAGAVKYLVLGVLTVATVGLGYLATVLTVPRDAWHRSWVDKWLGLMVIDIREGRDPRHEGVGGSLTSDVVPLSELAGPGVAEPGRGLPPAAPPRPQAPAPQAPTPQAPAPQAPAAQAPQPPLPPPGPAPRPFAWPSPGQAPQQPSAWPLPPPGQARPASQVPAAPAPHAPTPAEPAPHAQPDPGPEPAPVASPPAPDTPQAGTPTASPASGGRDAPPAPGQEPETRVNPQVGTEVKPVRVRLADGSVVLIDGPTAFGRNPVQPPGHPNARLVPVEDPGRSVSKTHAVLTPQPGGVLVEDLHSTNGTSILTDRGHVVVPAEVRLAARVGWRVALADLVLVVEDA